MRTFLIIFLSLTFYNISQSQDIIGKWVTKDGDFYNFETKETFLFRSEVNMGNTSTAQIHNCEGKYVKKGEEILMYPRTCKKGKFTLKYQEITEVFLEKLSKKDRKFVKKQEAKFVIIEKARSSHPIYYFGG